MHVLLVGSTESSPGPTAHPEEIEAGQIVQFFCFETLLFLPNVKPQSIHLLALIGCTFLTSDAPACEYVA